MTVMDQIRKLDEQKAQLLQAAKQEALEAANSAVNTLNELGFSYRLVSDEASVRSVSTRTGTRRTGIRDEVLAFVKAHPDTSRADILEKMEAKGNKSAEQSISNALAALKKAGLIDNPDGGYRSN